MFGLSAKTLAIFITIICVLCSLTTYFTIDTKYAGIPACILTTGIITSFYFGVDKQYQTPSLWLTLTCLLCCYTCSTFTYWRKSQPEDNTGESFWWNSLGFIIPWIVLFIVMIKSGFDLKSGDDGSGSGSSGSSSGSTSRTPSVSRAESAQPVTYNNTLQPPPPPPSNTTITITNYAYPPTAPITPQTQITSSQPTVTTTQVRSPTVTTPRELSSLPEE
jgi:hypothetical protein